jgi:hypothetical protein
MEEMREKLHGNIHGLVILAPPTLIGVGTSSEDGNSEKNINLRAKPRQRDLGFGVALSHEYSEIKRELVGLAILI